MLKMTTWGLPQQRPSDAEACPECGAELRVYHDVMPLEKMNVTRRKCSDPECAFLRVSARPR